VVVVSRTVSASILWNDRGIAEGSLGVQRGFIPPHTGRVTAVTSALPVETVPAAETEGESER
jgi:hypothetical protein